MKSTASWNSVRTILRDNYRKYWMVPAMGMAWFLVWGFIPTVLSQSPDPESLKWMSFNQNFGYITAILILAVGSGLSVFSYLQNPGASNYMHSLPLRRGQLFGVNILSGLLLMAGPILINGVIMTLLSGNDWFVQWMIVTCISCFAIFSITAFAAMLSGNVLMHLFNTGFFCGFVSIFILMINAVCSSLLTGYAGSDTLMTYIFLANPLSASVGNGTSRALICVIYLAAGLAALILAWLLYRRRHIERTGDSVMFPWVRIILFLYCIFCGSAMSGIVFADIFSETGAGGFSAPLVIGILVGALLIFLIGSVLIDRSAKIFTRRNLLPAALALILILVLTWGLSMDVFGYGSRIPDTEDVKTVYLNPDANELFDAGLTTDYYGWESRFNAKYYNESADRAVLSGHEVLGMHSSEAIDAVRQLHQELISRSEQKEPPVYYDVVQDTIELIYVLKNGHRIHRMYSFYIPYDQITGDTDVNDALVKAAGAYYDSKEFRETYSLMNLKPEVFGKGTISYQQPPADDENEDGETRSYAIPGKYAAQLQTALERDFQECSFSESLDCTAFFTIMLPGNAEDIISFPVPDASVHTSSWLKEHEKLLK